MHESRKSENSSWVVTPGGELVSREIPSMVDIFSGPNAPLATAFQMCGWQVAVLDKAIRSSDDLDSTARQQELRDQVQSVTFVAAAFDCSTKSRVRENEREFEDGRQTPGPPRSESHPEGLPSLRGAAKRRAERGNAVTHLILQPLEDHDARRRRGRSGWIERGYYFRQGGRQLAAPPTSIPKGQVATLAPAGKRGVRSPRVPRRNACRRRPS
jgi:hypothetical protein